MDYTRKCPKCNRSLSYANRDSYTFAAKQNTACKSCSIKRLYEVDPTKNKGDKNGRTGKTNLEIMINKYGKEQGRKKHEAWMKECGKHGFKEGDQNPSFGKINKNSGRSYKGWYKELFFRSSLELLFILEFEKKNDRLPLGAEGTFRIKYCDGSKTYCPDFFDPIERKLFEIKSEQFLEVNAEKFEVGRSFAEQNKIEFVVVTEKSLPYSESGIVWKLKRLQEGGIIKLTDASKVKLNNRIEKIQTELKKLKEKKKK